MNTENGNESQTAQENAEAQTTQTTEQTQTEQTNEQSTEENKFEFNPNAFFQQENTSMDNSSTSENNDSVDNNDGVSNDSSSTAENTTTTTDEFNWETAEKLVESEKQENNNDSNADGGSDATANQNNNQLAEFSYNEFAQELGIEGVNSKEEFVDAYKKVQEERDILKKSFPEKNEKIESFEKLIKLEDNKLVERSLVADGFEGVELQQAIEKLQDNDMIDLEAKKIRKTLNKAITAEQDAIVESKRKETARQEQERLDSINNLNKYLNSKDEMFGFKMASTPEKIEETRKSHQEYIVSGKFLQDITKSEQDLADAAWLWKHKDVILKAMQTKGFNNGRKDVLNQIGNPDADAGQRTFVDPKGNGEFNPSKFVGGK